MNGPDTSPPRTLGILGGTFNPPHLGHLALAGSALKELGLAEVALIPAAIMPHKPRAQDPGSEHRLAMCQLAVAGQERLSVCAIELMRGGPSYTVDTLTDIHAQRPDSQLTFIMGADTARTLASWREPQRLLDMAQLAIAERDRSSEDLMELLGSLHPRPRVRFLKMAPVGLSSSMVRERVRGGESVAELLTPSVADYITEHNLYTEITCQQ